jgi:hypothetical protein
VGAHDPRFDLSGELAELAAAKVENFCSARVEPQLGQQGVPWFLLRTSFSKT